MLQANLVQPTTGRYICKYNLHDGLIAATRSYGPDYWISRGESDSLVAPPLTHWSDVVFLAYKHLAQYEGNNLNKLSMILRMNIENDDTRDAILNVLTSSGHERPERGWEHRVDFDASTKEAQALIATVHGRGVAWFCCSTGEIWGVRLFGV